MHWIVMFLGGHWSIIFVGIIPDAQVKSLMPVWWELLGFPGVTPDTATLIDDLKVKIDGLRIPIFGRVSKGTL